MTPPIDGGTHATVSVLSTTPAHTTYPHARVRDHDLQRMITLRTVLLRCEATNHAAHAPDAAHAWSRTHAPLASRTPHVTRPSRGRSWSSPPARTQRAYKTRPDQPVRARNVFGSGVRTLAVVRAVLTTIATLTTPLRHVILLGFVV